MAIRIIKRCQRELLFASESEVALQYLAELAELPISVRDVQRTGIGRTVRGICRMEGPVAMEARSLFRRWEQMARAEAYNSGSESKPEAIPAFTFLAPATVPCTLVNALPPQLNDERVGQGVNTSRQVQVATLSAICTSVLWRTTRRAPYAGSELSRKGASARQLSSLEEDNPRLQGNADDLWRLLCQKDWRCGSREEMGTWRATYWRRHEERELRLKNFKAKIGQSNAKPATKKRKVAPLIQKSAQTAKTSFRNCRRY